MILIGMFDSPFVRRVAVSMNLLELPFEHRNWSVGKDFELIRQFNPLGRVPALVLADGESLIDSAAILDFLDDLVGPERALLPQIRQGAPRRLAGRRHRARRGGKGTAAAVRDRVQARGQASRALDGSVPPPDARRARASSTGWRTSAGANGWSAAA